MFPLLALILLAVRWLQGVRTSAYQYEVSGQDDTAEKVGVWYTALVTAAAHASSMVLTTSAILVMQCGTDHETK